LLIPSPFNPALDKRRPRPPLMSAERPTSDSLLEKAPEKHVIASYPQIARTNPSPA
jgi:hypothetical protein